jgi:putative FmdB family regulatory protein
MPIYEYRCKACGATSEYLIGMGKDEIIACKECGSTEMERILSVASFMGGISEHAPGRTCCGREERCERPPCSEGGTCRRE